MADLHEISVTDEPLLAKSKGHSRQQFVPVAVIVAGGCFFLLTSPLSLPPFVLIISFVVLAGMIVSLLTVVIRLAGLRRYCTARQIRMLLITATALPVLLLILQSIGQLTVRDIITLGGLFVIGLFYVNRVWPRND